MSHESLDFVDPDQLIELSGALGQLGEQLARLKNGTSPQPRPAPPITAEIVRNIVRARRARSELFGSGIFADPAWDILLDLYAARLEGRRVSVSSLCIASDVPPTTALRWIKLLQDRDLVRRSADPSDGRRIYLEISAEVAAKVAQALKKAQTLGVLLV